MLVGGGGGGGGGETIRFVYVAICHNFGIYFLTE